MIDRFRDEYFFLSNFSPAIIEVAGLTFPTVEHAFVAAKVPLDYPERYRVQQHIASLATPGQAKRLGRKGSLRKDWMRVRVPIMRRLLELKFVDDRLDKLVATAPHMLVEGNDWNDTFWGVCRGDGQNQLGLLLMWIRASHF